MKRIIIAFVAVFASNFAFCQEPTTTKKENLKGNVFAVRSSSYVYSENFGNPTEGKLRHMEVTLFDSHGRAVLYHYDTEHYGSAYGLVNYTIDGENTVANISMLSPKKRIEELNSINELNNFLEEAYFVKREIVYNNNIVVKHDVLKRIGSTSKYELDHRKTVKPLGNGAYECKLYDKSGQSFLDFKETYNSNGQLTKLDNEREFNRVYSYDKEIIIPHAGEYQYNNKGQLILYTQQKNSAPEKTEYIYNDHGDLTQVNTLVFHQGRKEYAKNKGLVYDNYKYDNNGNWIYRMVSDGKKYLYIEKRQIDYCNTTEEIESKVKELYSKLPVIDMKAAEEFSDFYKKYLKGTGYTGQIPLIEYDSKYASVKNADKVSVVIKVYFGDPNCEGRQYLRLTMPDKYYSKFINVAEEIQNENREYKYVYRDGKLIMNNEEYVIDTSTGEMKNITRNITLKKE
jgi:hypothetical protein